MGDWEQKNHLIDELAGGRELAKQLQSHQNLSNETREVLVQKIIASYEKALSMLTCSAVGTSSPPSLNGSPRSDQDSDPEQRNTGLGKRKSMPRWTKQVRVSPGMRIEGHLEDGFSWRKYGKKDILRASYPREYYRCTHRHVRGCLATKQVQRADQDPTIFEVAYKGRHTCNNSTSSEAAPPPDDQTQQEPTHHSPQNQSEEQLLMAYFRTGLKVLTDELDSTHQDHTISPSFHFPYTSNIVINNPENHFFPVQNNLAENFITPPFLSQATSVASYFGGSPGYQNFQSCEADQFTEIISSSAATSGTNSPTIGLDFQFGNAEFDTHFTFDSPGFNSNW